MIENIFVSHMAIWFFFSISVSIQLLATEQKNCEMCNVLYNKIEALLKGSLLTKDAGSFFDL